MALPQMNEAMIGRHFANAVMHWKVSNISLALCSPNILVQSPEFTLTGPVPTRWKMSLDISCEDDRILLYLEMLPNDIKNLRVKVNWIAYIMNPTGGDVALAVERAHTFEPDCRMAVDIFELWSVINKMPDASPDVLKIRCSMLVQFGYNPQFSKAESNGIMSLSHDLSRLTKESLYSDMKVEVKGVQFPVHRAMLYHRGEHLADQVRTYTDNQKARFYLSDRDAVESVLCYLYSGDLSSVLSNPSIMIRDYIGRFGIPELKNIYPLEKLKLESRLVTDEHVFRWTIADFRNIREPLSGEVLLNASLESRWQLHLYPWGPPRGRPDQQKNFLYLEAEVLYSVRPINVCLEFASVNNKDEVIHTRRIHGSMKTRDRVGLEYFRVGGTNMEKSLVDGALHLRFTVRVATGEITCQLRESNPPSPLPINSEHSYLIFSQMMGLLLTSPDFSDVGLLVDGDLFRAHRFVLAARSPMFKRLLEPSSKLSTVVLTIPNIRKHVFRVFLEFLYTGLLTDSEPPVLVQLYEISRKFGVSSLVIICLDSLLGSVNPENVLHLYMWSSERKETAVKTRCLNMIALMGEAIKDNSDWNLLSMTKPQLCEEILDFLGYNRSRTLPIIPES